MDFIVNQKGDKNRRLNFDVHYRQEFLHSGPC